MWSWSSSWLSDTLAAGDAVTAMVPGAAVGSATPAGQCLSGNYETFVKPESLVGNHVPVVSMRLAHAACSCRNGVLRVGVVVVVVVAIVMRRC